MTADAPALDAGTMTEAFRRTVAARGPHVAMRSSDGKDVTWAQWGSLAARYAAGMQQRGIGRGDVVALVLTNRPDVYILDMAALLTGAAAFAIYETSSPEQIAHQLAVAGSRIVVTEGALADRVRAACDLMSGPPTVFVLDAEDDSAAASRLMNDTSPALSHFPGAEPEDVATLIFTSGTTGLPKAAELTHHNVLAACRSSDQIIPLTASCRLVSYLPVANIADRVLSYYYALVSGGSISFVREIRQFIGLLPHLRPTILLCVPRTWEMLVNAMRDAGRATSTDFTAALEGGIERVRTAQRGEALSAAQEATQREDEMRIWRPLRSQFGLEDLVFAMSGSAPIGVETLEFCSAIGIPIREGYGMSETTGIVLMNPADKFRIGTIGLPAPGVETRQAVDGELLVRGEMVMRGYRGLPEETAAVLDSGWLHTGDIVDVDSDGYVRVIGRKKEIFISSSGKNMSPALIEQAIAAESEIVGTVVCIGDGRPYNVALILLDPDGLTKLLATRGIDPGSPLAESSKLPVVVEEVGAAVKRGNAKLNRPEQIRAHSIVPVAWSPGDEEMTPTMKVRRQIVADKHANLIEELYAATADAKATAGVKLEVDSRGGGASS